MKAILALLVFFAVVPGASAQVLLDAFFDNTILVSAPAPPSSVITNDINGGSIDREIAVSASGSYSIVSQVLDGVFVADAGMSATGAADVEITYLGFVLDLGANTFFQFSTDRIVGTPVLGLILSDANFGQLTGGLLLGPVTSTTVFSIDITQLSGYVPGFGSELNGVTVLFGTSVGDMFVEGNSFSFSAVPEPSSLVLISAVFPVLVIRRRRKALG